MKRFAGMMGALLLMPTLAMASGDMVSISELRQQVEAIGRWTQTYDTPNGEVSVDIPIIVPEVENMPILQVGAVTGKDVAEEKGLIKSEEQGNGILYEDFDILSKLSVDVSNAATIFCANPEETNLAFFQVNLDEPLAKRLGNWDYLNDASPETYTLFPVWVCDCDYTDNSKEKIMNNIVDDNFRRGFIFSQILFNAQTGKMESQWLKKTEMLYCPEVITWENTQ